MAAFPTGSRVHAVAEKVEFVLSSLDKPLSHLSKRFSGMHTKIATRPAEVRFGAGRGALQITQHNNKHAEDEMRFAVASALLIGFVPSLVGAQGTSLQAPQGQERYPACCTTCAQHFCSGCFDVPDSGHCPDEIPIAATCATAADTTVCTAAGGSASERMSTPGRRSR
jgi:hypothetical protein